MSLLRPEVSTWLRRWAESLAALGLAGLGVWALWRGFARFNQVQELIGLVMLVIGLAAFWASFQRARFARGHLGPGLVEIDERQISYMTPLGGAAVDLEALTRIEMRTYDAAGRVWVLKQSRGASLQIPVNAAGADRLFDAFSALPGMESTRLVAAVNATSDQRDVIWRAPNRFRALT